LRSAPSINWSAHQDDHSILRRLAQCLPPVAAELGQLVEEEDAVVGEAHLPGTGDAPAADEPGVGDRVVGKEEDMPASPRRAPRVSDADGKQTGQRHLPPTMLLWAAARRAVTGAE
jgi:hypothetical protein